MKTKRRNSITLSDGAITALVAERAKFHRFLAARLNNSSDAEDLLQDSLLRALQRGDSLRRGERVIPWFYRIVRRSLVDHFRQGGANHRKLERLANELPINGDTTAAPDWERAVCACFEGLLPALKPRYAELLRRVDLNGEMKPVVAGDMKLSAGAFNVALHRARQALRDRLEVFCGACSREHCRACACRQTRRPVRKEKV